MKQAKRKMIFGQSGTGKSNLARKLAMQYDRILIVDRSCEDYSGGIIFENIDDLKAFWNKVYKKNFRLIYRPYHFDDEQLKAELDTLSDWVYKCGNMAFLVEELNIIFDGQRFPKNLNLCVFGGRKRGVEMLLVSQRPVGYGQAALSQASVFYIFTTIHPDDLRCFRDFMDDTVIEKIKALEQYHYLEWDFTAKQEDRGKVAVDDYIENE